MPNRLLANSIRSLSLLMVLVIAVFGCSPEVDMDVDTDEMGDATVPLQLDRNTRLVEPASDDSTTPSLIILISIDTLRPDHLGHYGYPIDTSPILDGFSREGVLFVDASSTSPWTLPSHASMLTGLYPLRHGAVSTARKMSETIPTLASLLAKSGFETAAVVNSTYLKKYSWGLDRGFKKHHYVLESLTRVGPSTQVTNQAMQWIRDRGEQPLFVFMHYYDVHSSYRSLPKFERLIVKPYEGSADGTNRQLYLADLDEGTYRKCHEEFVETECTLPDGSIIDQSVVRPQFDERDIAHTIALYDAAIRQLDDELGRLFRFLREWDLVDDSLVIITSDHGEEFFEHGGLEHSTTQYEETIRVPFLIRGPGVPKGQRIQVPVSLVDVTPTILALAGAAAPRGMDGVDLSQLWEGGDTSVFDDRAIFSEASGMRAGQKLRRSIRDGKYKLHYEFVEGTHQLYDLAVDPTEKFDISETHQEISADLIDRLTARYQSPSMVETSEIEVDEESIEMLKALGYLNW
jgi:arylsulfatase A-like enzyme